MQALEAVQNHIVFLNAQLASPDVGVKQYTEQLEVFDRAIQTQAFAELSEDERARRLRSRDHLACYLEESKAELEGFGPLFDSLNDLEPVEELEQEMERQNAPLDYPFIVDSNKPGLNCDCSDGGWAHVERDCSLQTEPDLASDLEDGKATIGQ